MLFNSIAFLVFFPLVTIFYFVIPHKYRWAFLLAASCYFYMSFIPHYILILLITIVIDYVAGMLIEKEVHAQKKKKYLIISIVSTIAVLFLFKYFNFFNANMQYIAKMIHWNYPVKFLSVILPIGLSFHTFQSLSYVIEVYRGNQKAERNFGIYALYVMFYPQLVAGPIERPQNLLHQFYEKHEFDYNRVTDGLKLMAWGMFKKVVIADRLAVYVDGVYSNPQNFQGLSLILATVFFAFQIYSDFSGYSDIAIGSAKVMGFDLMVNFKRPYFSKSIFEFWRRWHISLSTWFKDYLYIPLGGNRVGFWRKNLNLLIVFAISGLWHGASWNFVIWGILHGFYMIVSSITLRPRRFLTHLIKLDRLPVLHKFLQVLNTFILVCLAWIFFRADSVKDAQYIILNLGKGILTNFHTLSASIKHLIALQSSIDFYIAILSISFLEIIHFMQRKESIRKVIGSKPIYIRWSLYVGILMAILLFGYFKNQNFIYFQF